MMGHIYILSESTYHYSYLVELVKESIAASMLSGKGFGFQVTRDVYLIGPETAGQVKAQDLQRILNTIEVELRDALYPKGTIH